MTESVAINNTNTTINTGSSPDDDDVVAIHSGNDKESLHARIVISGVKLRYLCRNKLPRIILVLMYDDDYVISTSSISPGVQR